MIELALFLAYLSAGLVFAGIVSVATDWDDETIVGAVLAWPAALLILLGRGIGMVIR